MATFTVKGRVRKNVDGHSHPKYGELKAGTVVDVELIPEMDPRTGKDSLYFPGGVFEPEGWVVPIVKGAQNWHLTPEFVAGLNKPADARKGGDA